MSRALAASVEHPAVLRIDIPTDTALRTLLSEPLAPGVRSTPPRRTVIHDLYFDTPGRLLEQTGVSCGLRTQEDGSRTLVVAEHSPLLGIGGPPDLEHRAPVRARGDDWRSEDTPAVRLLRDLVDPAELVPVIEVATERHRRLARAGLLRRPCVACDFETVTVRVGGEAAAFREAALREPPDDIDAGLVANEIGMYWSMLFPMIAPELSPLGRARLLADTIRGEARAAGLGVGRSTVVVVSLDDRVACLQEAGSFELPRARGCGALVAAELAERAGGYVHHLARVGHAAPTPERDLVEVWHAPADRSRAASGMVWTSLIELLAGAGGPSVMDGTTLAALAVLAESPVTDEILARGAVGVSATGTLPGEPTMLDAELSMIDFNARVLTMAENRRAAVGDRLRMLAITCANVDEFIMVRLAELRASLDAPARPGNPRDLGPASRFDAARGRLAALEDRQAKAFAACIAALAEQGTRVRSWSNLSGVEQDELRAWFATEVAPRITTGGMTLILGHPFPRLPSLTLSLCVAGRSRVSNQWRLVQFDLPRELPRFIDIPGTADVIQVEAVARACADVVYPELRVAAAHVFRVLREGDLDLTEQGDLFARVEEGTRRRGFNHIVRIEVERAMPKPVREALLATFQVEPGIANNALTSADVHSPPALLAMADVRELCARAQVRTPAHDARSPTIAPLSAVWSEIAERDRLFHHPYVSYDATVLRFFAAAAADPQVRSISITLYRVGDPSPVVDALLAARAAGKAVLAYVELTARFDETRNLSWVQRLEEGGVKVAYGHGDLKCHAKVALVERTEDGAIRRYAHVGTGNYNALSARMYTDFSLLTADLRITNDLRRFFDWLPSEPRGTLAPGHLLVAPAGLLGGMLARIDREIAHARGGRTARIRLKLNALSEAELVQALYRASKAGVDIDLIVRGICTLRPEVPGLSERIRVSSRIGRYLEHGRIYHFANGGEDDYLIASADWRPRNMRRRIEVAVPVLDAHARAHLDRILDIEIDDPARWRLGPDGRYAAPLPGDGPTADERFAAT